MEFWLPVVFAGLMALAMLIYVVLDGYDLGVGVLLNGGDDREKDMMIASIGPFWDANETWLVLGVGILLIAFPMAHGIILSSLYLEVAVMLVGLILRGSRSIFGSRRASRTSRSGMRPSSAARCLRRWPRGSCWVTTSPASSTASALTRSRR